MSIAAQCRRRAEGSHRAAGRSRHGPGPGPARPAGWPNWRGQAGRPPGRPGGHPPLGTGLGGEQLPCEAKFAGVWAPRRLPIWPWGFIFVSAQHEGPKYQSKDRYTDYAPDAKQTGTELKWAQKCAGGMLNYDSLRWHARS